MNLSKVAAMLLALTLVGGACSTGRGPDVVGEVAPVQGQIVLIRDGEELEVVESEEVGAGDVLSVAADSVGLLHLRSGTELELRTSQLTVLDEGTVELESGTVLVTSATDAEVRAAGVASTAGSGNVRFDLGETLRVATYNNDAVLSVSADVDADVPSYWQAVYAEDGSVLSAGPLQFSREDPIDRRLLAIALQVDSDLGNLLRGLEPQLAEAGEPTVTAYMAGQGIPPALLTAFPDSSKSDLLVALAFARQRIDALPPNLGERFELFLYLRSRGATWGLLAQQYSLSSDDVLAGLEQEIVAVLFPLSEEVAPGGELVPRPEAPPAPPAPPPPPAPSRPPPAPGEPEPTRPPPPPGSDPPPGLLPDELVRIVDELFGLVDNLL